MPFLRLPSVLTYAVVLRSLSHGIQNWICSSGILWMYFGFMYGILFAGRIITRNTRKQRKSKICSAEVGRVPRPTRQRKHGK